MRTLVIDCATEACSVALFDKGELLAREHQILGRGHAEHLIPMIGRLPNKGKAGLIAVSLGPGSFTGVRIGLAAARALALAWNARAVGYPTLALVAAMALEQSGARKVTVAMTGGHGEFFVQNYAEGVLAEGEFASLKPEMAAGQATAELVAGNQAEKLVSLRESGHALTILPDAAQFHLVPESLLQPAEHPIYGRAPDAKLPGAA